MRLHLKDVVWDVACAGVLPLVFAAFLVNNDWKQQLVVVAITVTLCVLAVVRRERADDDRESALAAVVLGGALLILACCAWSWAYLGYTRTVAVTSDIFRGVYAGVRGPVYGWPTIALDAWAVVGAGVALSTLVFVALLWRRELARSGPLFVLMVLYAATIATLAMTDGVDRLTRPVLHQARFFDNVALFSGPADIMARYVDAMPSLHRLTRHYPPGYTWLASLELAGSLPGLLKSLTIGATIATPLVLVAVLAELGERRVAPHAFLLAATSTAPAVFATTDVGALQMLLASVSLWLLARAVQQNGFAAPVALSIVMLAFSLLSASALFFGAALAMILAIASRVRVIDGRRALSIAAVVGATYLAGLWALQAASGFDAYAWLPQARAHAQELMMTRSGFDDPARYLLRSSGNVLAFATMAGLPLSALALAYVFRSRRRRTVSVSSLADAFAAGSLLGIVVAGFGGAYYMETERIWTFFVPGLVIAAALVQADWAHRHGVRFVLPVVASAIATTWAAELVFRH